MFVLAMNENTSNQERALKSFEKWLCMFTGYTCCPLLYQLSLLGVLAFDKFHQMDEDLHMHHSARQPLFTVSLYVLKCSLGGDYKKKRSPIHARLLLSEGPDKWSWRVWMFKGLIIWFGLKIWFPPCSYTDIWKGICYDFTKWSDGRV